MLKSFLIPLSIAAVLATASCNKPTSAAASTPAKKEMSEDEAYQAFKKNSPTARLLAKK